MNVYAYRGCSMFQHEIVSVMRAMREILVARYDYLEPYIKISCEKTHGALDDRTEKEGYPKEMIERPDEATAHHCTFQGWEEVERQCPFSWARDTNRTFRSEHHAIKASKP
jgi:hypothetical protein